MARKRDQYDCPHCGAIDSTRCVFRTSDRTGTVILSEQGEAREVGCRVMHYTDRNRPGGQAGVVADPDRTWGDPV